MDAWNTRNKVTYDAKNLVARKARNLKAFLIDFSIALVIWTFDQLGSLFIMGHHFHSVPKSLKLRIDVFKSYLLSKKQIGLVSKLRFGFMHGFLKIRVLKCFACARKGVESLWMILKSVTCGRKRKIRYEKSRHLLSTCSH